MARKPTISSVLSLSHVWIFATPGTAARQASLSITNFQSPPKPMSIESMMPSNHLILCRPLLLLLSIFPSIRIFSNESAHNIKQIISFPADSSKEDNFICIPVKIFPLEPKVKKSYYLKWLRLAPLFIFPVSFFFVFSFLFVFNCLCSCFIALLKHITPGGLWKF